METDDFTILTWVTKLRRDAANVQDRIRQLSVLDRDLEPLVIASLDVVKGLQDWEKKVYG